MNGGGSSEFEPIYLTFFNYSFTQQSSSSTSRAYFEKRTGTNASIYRDICLENYYLNPGSTWTFRSQITNSTTAFTDLVISVYMDIFSNLPDGNYYIGVGATNDNLDFLPIPYESQCGKINVSSGIVTRKGLIESVHWISSNPIYGVLTYLSKI